MSAMEQEPVPPTPPASDAAPPPTDAAAAAAPAVQDVPMPTVIVNSAIAHPGSSADSSMVSKFSATLPDCSEESRKQILEKVLELQRLTRSLGLEVHLVVIEKQNAFGCFIRCETLEALNRLHEMFLNSQLRIVLQAAFDEKTRRGGQRMRIKRIRWLKTDYDRAVEYFNSLSLKAEPETESSDDTNDTLVDLLPVEVMEPLLLKALTKLFSCHYKSCLSVAEADQFAYNTLAGVCTRWWQTIDAEHQPDVSRRIHCRLKRFIRDICRPFRRRPLPVSSVDLPYTVCGIASIGNRLFVTSGDYVDVIRVFGIDGERRDDIRFKGFGEPRDVVACADTASLYVIVDVMTSRREARRIWRLSTVNGQASLFHSGAGGSLVPQRMSARWRRLLVTAKYDHVVLFDADGAEIRRLTLPGCDVTHAVETSRGSFVVAWTKPQPRVCEVGTGGHVINVYETPPHLLDLQQLGEPCCLALCGPDDRIVVADCRKRNVLLLDRELRLERVLLDGEYNRLPGEPCRLCCVDQSRRLIVLGCVGEQSTFFVQTYVV